MKKMYTKGGFTSRNEAMEFEKRTIKMWGAVNTEVEREFNYSSDEFEWVVRYWC